MAQKKKYYRVTVYNMNNGLAKNGKPAETEEMTVRARNQAEAERLAVTGGLICRENGWGAWDSVEVDEKGHKVNPAKAKTTTRKPVTKTVKKTAKNTAGMTREEQSRELFKNIREYNLLGFRIGDGLRNMFNTLVTSFSKKKASVHPIYTYTVHGGTSLVTYNFGIGITGEKLVKYSVDVVINKNKPEKAGLHLSFIPDAPGMGFKVSDFPFSEQGIKDMLKEIKAIK